MNLFTDEQLRQLLEVSRHNNSACGVTGMLLYLDGNFIQVLEGEKADVMKTHARIAKDQRHRGLITLLEDETGERDFSEWSMGFRKVTASDAASLPGYSDFLRREVDLSGQKSAALRLLENFKKANR